LIFELKAVFCSPYHFRPSSTCPAHLIFHWNSSALARVPGPCGPLQPKAVDSGLSPSSGHQATPPPLLSPSCRVLPSLALPHSGEDEAKRHPGTYIFPNKSMPRRVPFIFKTADFKMHSLITIELLRPAASLPLQPHKRHLHSAILLHIILPHFTVFLLAPSSLSMSFITAVCPSLLPAHLHCCTVTFRPRCGLP
jgi:hypothetical protein